MIYDIEGYVNTILDAKKKNKFEIRRMERCFIHLKEEVKKFGRIKRTVNEQGEKIEFQKKVRQIRITKFGSYEYKHSPQ